MIGWCGRVAQRMLRFFLIFLRYVVLVSGLGLGGSRYDALATQMFIDTITGELGGLSVLMIARFLC